MKRAARLAEVPSYPFARWTGHCREAQARGLDVIRLDMGNPDMPPHEEVVERLCRSAHEPTRHGYPGFRGTALLREAIAAYYARRFGVELDPETQIVPLIGSKEGIVNMSLACVDPGDPVLVPDPGYAPYTMGTLLAGGKAVRFPLQEERGFLPDLRAIPSDVADGAEMMWLNYPNNPTGAVADLAFFSEAAAFAGEHGILLCHDAPYTDLAYDEHRPPSLLQVPGAADVAVEFNSLSKTYNMAGWRIGMAVGNPSALALLSQVKSNIDSGIFAPLQDAAAQALYVGEDWITSRNAVYRERLALVLGGLGAIGLSASLPRATPYIWARVPSGWGSEAFALALLGETGVSIAPGSFFGPGGEGYVRISATVPTERIREATERLRRMPKGWILGRPSK